MSSSQIAHAGLHDSWDSRARHVQTSLPEWAATPPEFEASGIDDQSLLDLLRRLGQASDALRARVDAARHELRETESAARETVAAARVESDELRSRAHAVLDEIRAEVTALTGRRDAIVRELTGLSGVIEALAVDGPPAYPNESPTVPGPSE